MASGIGTPNIAQDVLHVFGVLVSKSSVKGEIWSRVLNFGIIPQNGPGVECMESLQVPGKYFGFDNQTPCQKDSPY